MPGKGPSAHSTEGSRPEQLLLQLVVGAWRAQAVFALVSLEIPDALRDESLTAAELAGRLGVDSTLLSRLLRTGVEIGLLHALEEDRFALSSAGILLQRTDACSARDLMLFLGAEWHMRCWSRLSEAIKCGKRSAYELEHGMPFLIALDSDSNLREAFERAMNAYYHLSGGGEELDDIESVSVYPYPGNGMLVDLGCGDGTLAATILRRRPDLTAVLLELPKIAAGVSKRIKREGLNERCVVVAGDFFEGVPKGGDVYLLANVLEDWDDADAKRILHRCRSAMGLEARLLILEANVDDDTSGVAGRAFEVEQLAVVGGRQRSARELGELLGASGFKILQHQIVGNGALTLFTVAPDEGSRR